MAHKKRPSKRKASPNKKRSDVQEISSAMKQALAGLAKPAHAILDRVDKFKREHPELYEIITRDVDGPHYRKFERKIERAQERIRRGR